MMVFTIMADERHRGALAAMWRGQSTKAATEAQLRKLKQQIVGVTGEDLAEQPDLAAKLSQACATLKAGVLDAARVSQLTGRLKRRVVLD